MTTSVYTLLIILFAISNFISNSILDFLIGTTAVLALIISSRKANGLYLKSGLIFLFFGISLFIYNKLPWYTFVLHFKSMLGLLSLFIVLPFINSLIRVGHYDKNLSKLLMYKIKTYNHLYIRSSLICHFLGLFLNIATIPLLINSLNVSFQDTPKMTANKFYTRNLLRAYALCLTWNPMEVMVSTSIDITKGKYYQLFPVMLTLAFITFLIDWAISRNQYKKFEPLEAATHSTVNIRQVNKKVFQLLIMLLIFIVLVSFIQYSLHQGFLFSVVLLLTPFSIAWAIIIKISRRYFTVTIPYWKDRVYGLSNYFFMFLSAGLFIQMLSSTKALSFLQALFVTQTNKPTLFFLYIGIYFLITSLIGFHPLVSLTFLSSLIQSSLPYIPILPLTIVLIACSLATVMYSPFNLSVSLLSEQLTLNPYRIVYWNVRFAVLYMLLGIATALAIGNLI